KLDKAKLEQEGAEEHLRLARQRYDRLKGAGEAISTSELDTAATQLNEARTQAETAKAGVREWQAALAAIDGSGKAKGKTWRQPAGPGPRVAARLVGPAPQVEAASQYAAFWYEADVGDKASGKAGWRPGLFVKALVKVPGAAAERGVSVPEGSLLYHQGRALV